LSIIKPKQIDDRIINHLKSGPILTLDLVKTIQQDRPNTTKQAVYAALRSLKAQEIVLTNKGISSLNIAWVNQMVDYLNFTKNKYVTNDNQGSFLDLEDKEKIKYYFNTANKGDVFWTHAYYLLLECLTENEPVFLYNSHEWFLLARTENEKAVISSTINKSHKFLLTSGSDTFLDKQVRKYFDGDKSQYNILAVPLFKENNYYLNIFGDFLIEVWLDQKIAQKIDEFYQTTIQWDENAEIKIKEIINASGRMKMIISRNRAKAEKLKKTLRKDFAISVNKIS